MINKKEFEKQCITSDQFFDTYYNTFAQQMSVWYAGCYKDYSSEDDCCRVFYVKLGLDQMQVDSTISTGEFFNRCIADNVADKIIYYGHCMRP